MTPSQATNRQVRGAARQLFAPAPDSARRRVGVELELIPSRPLPRRDVEAAFAARHGLSFEPGGQLELSPPAAGSARAAVCIAAALIGRARAVAAGCGASLALVGVDPAHDWDEVPLYLPSPRYLALQEMFDTDGPDGRRMMRLTASLQVCVDLLPGPAGTEQWLVANLAGPALTAAFANSPGVARSRTAIWRGVDRRRTGYDGRHLDAADAIGAYAAFAAAAPRLPIPDADAAYHLTTLFPPVRPRGGYLEVRYLDAQPLERIGTAVDTVTALLYDAPARREALDLLLPRLGDLDTDWQAAAGGRSATAADVLAIAAAAVARRRRAGVAGRGCAA